MERKCSAFMCSKTVEDGVKLFQFPENYTHNWIFAVDRGPTWTPDINSRLCSDHFPPDASFESDKMKDMKFGSEPNPGAATSIHEEEKLILVSKLRSDNLRQEELEAKNKMNEIMSKENPELWEVVLMLRKKEVELQEFATEVTNRFAELDPLGDKKIHAEKIINKIKATQSKVEGYIMKGRKNKEMDFGLKLPKLEPVTEEEIEEDHKRGIIDPSVAHDTIYKMKKEDHVESQGKPNFEIDTSLYCESVLDMAVALDEAKFLKEIGSGLNSLDYVNEEKNVNYYDDNDYDSDYDQVSIKKEVKPRVIKPKTSKPRSRSKTGITKKKPCCKLCVHEEILPSPIELRKHVLQVHGEPPYQCIKCEHKLETYVKFAAHFNNVHNHTIVECTVCKKEMKQVKMKLHMMRHTGERPHSCDICGKSFILLAQFKIHMRVHTGDRPYKCKLCTNSYKQGAHLRHHIKSIHEGIKISQTKKDMTEEEKEALKRVCGICGKVLSCYQSYQAHERTHTGVKPYKCDICNKSFAARGGLANHKELHNETKNYSCELCGNSYKTKLSLYLHKKSHDKSLEKSLTCELCSLKFTLPCNLKRHIAVTHNKIKLHSCDVCQRAFGSRTEVKQHMRVHTGEKPFQCEICSKSFTQASSLWSHNKKNHEFINEK